MRPVTARSTLLVRNLLDPTEGNRSTLRRASMAEVPAGSASGASGLGTRLKWYVLLGMSPSTFSSSRSSGQSAPSGASRSSSVTRPEPVISPTTEKGRRSRSQILAMTSTLAGLMSMASFSWYSAPQMSRTDMVSSPSFTARMSMTPPRGSISSFRTLQLPPAPWSWMETMGLASPISTHVRTTRYSFWDISPSPRCTALKSSSTARVPDGTEEAAPPPMPMRYAGPPIFTTSMPSSPGSFSSMVWSMAPKPALNMMGLSHSRRSWLGSLCPKVRQ
mmetsp:Transcript_37183/g.71305  ORF Transcript_37183/g.71305 Transcript_37183/m.71305 type:complete len:276 (+) Transcript_37183:2195-3022(+)